MGLSGTCSAARRRASTAGVSVSVQQAGRRSERSLQGHFGLLSAPLPSGNLGDTFHQLSRSAKGSSPISTSSLLPRLHKLCTTFLVHVERDKIAHQSFSLVYAAAVPDQELVLTGRKIEPNAHPSFFPLFQLESRRHNF
jgi:hypothetical protein